MTTITPTVIVRDDIPQLSTALHDAYLTLVNLRPAICDTKYPSWQRTVRAIEDTLHIDPVERYTREE